MLVRVSIQSLEVGRAVLRAHIPLLPRPHLRLAIALRSFHNPIDIALCHQSAPFPRPNPHSNANAHIPIACLYSPYSLNRVADGGFCDPVRILFTVFSAWLNTRSTHLSISATTQHNTIRRQRLADVPTESDMTSVGTAPPQVGSVASISYRGRVECAQRSSKHCSRNSTRQQMGTRDAKRIQEREYGRWRA